MAELLVRVIDKPKTGDPYNDRHLSSAGCVIVIMPDGHKWSAAERELPWRIVKLPGVAGELLTQFTARDLGYLVPEQELSNKVLRRWTHKIDLDALDELLADAVKLDDIKKRPAKALAHVLKLRKELPVLLDPFLIGKPHQPAPIIGKP